MKGIKKISSALLAFNLVIPTQGMAQAERPPQFVMFAFDGSYTLDVWKESRKYTQDKKQEGIDTRFTFFINPVYLLTRETRNFYDAPGGKNGSAIGWGDSVSDVSLRIDQMNEAFSEGHEIGSHAIGHWDGSEWTQNDWNSEFSQFNKILDNLFSINKIRETKGGHSRLLFTDSITGFRAPKLGVSKGLWPTLAKYGFKYDTSKTNKDNYWPQKESTGLWNFPLGRIPEPGGARTWLSMDYNFCVRDSARILSEDKKAFDRTNVDPKSGKKIVNKDKLCLRAISAEQKKKVKQNMLSLYRAYFNKNYYGNRAPLHIGHHFSSWMSGAYLEVFYEFASEVCSKPEVSCGVYQDLTAFMETLGSSQIKSFQEGNFDKLARPKSLIMSRHFDLGISTSLDKNQDRLEVQLIGEDAKMKGLTLKVSNLDKIISNGQVPLSEIRKTGQVGEDLVIRLAVYDRKGQEVATSSHNLKAVGTQREAFDSNNLEEAWLSGHLEGAHSDEGQQRNLDFSK